jgi:hypothetical protein
MVPAGSRDRALGLGDAALVSAMPLDVAIPSGTSVASL